MKQKLIILSDLWGTKNAAWILKYEKQLSLYFDTKVYDTCVLANINIDNLREEQIHKKFVEGGIDKAVEMLLNQVKEKIIVLAFSIGGFIAWEAALKGLDFVDLYAVSATRLRNQKRKPKGHLMLYYGDGDLYKPNKKWFSELNIKAHIVENKGHELYKNVSFINRICKEILMNRNDL
jgi:hypothetical protein